MTDARDQNESPSDAGAPLASDSLRGRRRRVARESDADEPRRADPLSRIDVTHTNGPSQAIGPVGAGEFTIGLQLAGGDAFILVDEDDLVDPAEVR